VASSQKLTIGLLANLTLKVVLFRGYSLFLMLLSFFKMHPGSCVVRGCSAPSAIVAQSPQLYQNGGLSVLSSIKDRERSRVGGG
jgi:hypothetical protein